MFSFTSEELKLSGDVGFYGYTDREWWLGFKLRSPVPGYFPGICENLKFLPYPISGKDSWVEGRTAAISLIKDEFLAPYCYREKGTNPLVLTGNKENVAKPLWDKEGRVSQFQSEIYLTHSAIHYQLLPVWPWVSYFSPGLSFLICKMAIIIAPKWLPWE